MHRQSHFFATVEQHELVLKKTASRAGIPALEAVDLKNMPLEYFLHFMRVHANL